MIWSVEAGRERIPVANVHLPGGEVEPIYGFNAPVRLIVVTGAAGHAVSATQLLAPVRDRPGDCLALGVFGAGISELELEVLVTGLDAVFVVPGDEVAQVARSLALAVTTPGEPAHPWCCDWNDMRSLVSGAGVGVGRTASARAAGPSAAAEAVLMALEAIGSVENCRVLSLLTGSPDLRGAQIKEVSREIRARLGDGDHIAGVLQDPAYSEGTVRVDLFVFGPAVARAAPAAAVTASCSAGDMYDIPAFLRNAGD